MNKDMTRQEAIARIKDHKNIHKIYEGDPRTFYISKALDMAIESLEQESQSKSEDIAKAFQMGLAIGSGERYDELDKVIDEIKKVIDEIKKVITPLLKGHGDLFDKAEILRFLKCPKYENCDWKNCFDCNESRCINLNNVNELIPIIKADKEESEEV